MYKAVVKHKYDYSEEEIQPSVWVDKLVWAEGKWENTVKYISFFGSPMQVKSAIAMLSSPYRNFLICVKDDKGEDIELEKDSRDSDKVVVNRKVFQYYDGVKKRVMQASITFSRDSLITVDKGRAPEGIIQHLRGIIDTPIIDEKAQKIVDTLIEEGSIEKLQSIGFPEGKEFYYISYLSTGRIMVIQGVSKPDDGEEKSLSLKDFLQEYRDELKERVLSSLKPIHSKDNLTGEDKKAIEILNSLPKKPKKGQINPILAVKKGLKKKKGLFVVGEMGVGKTYISIASTLLMKGAKRIAVMCPTHLIEKWKREIKAVIPGAVIYDLNEMKISEIVAKGKTKPPTNGIEFWIVGREKAKLHYREKHISPYKYYKYAEVDDTAYKCPTCGYIMEGKLDKCPKCGKKLYYADNTSVRRYAVSLLLKKYVKFDIFIADEVHELKGDATAQGQALANLAAASRKVLALTGTLMGGYASNLFYLLWRVTPQLMVDKISIPYNSLRSFVKKYGVFEEIETVRQDHMESIGRRVSKRTKEKPGISPVLVSLILENAVFIKLSDISNDLPPYKEDVISVEMSEQQGSEYRKLEQKLMSEVRRALARGSKALLGKMVNSLYGFPDGARRGETVYNNDGVIASAHPVDEYMLPKEQQLIEAVKREKEAGRKCLVLLEHTGTRDLMPDLRERLEDEGISATKLYSSTVSTKKREAWINGHSDSDVLITNPRIVQTGLDLYDYPTIIFFQTGYSIYTLRQASRRSWRIGQTNPVNVYYFAYTDTIQEKAMSLMASKLETALSVEGDLTDKGLAALSESENSILVELAKSIVGDESVVVEPVEEVWKKARKEELFSDTALQKTHTETEITETTVSATSTTKVSVDDRKAEIKFTIVSNVNVSAKDRQAVFTFDGQTYLLKNGRVYANKRSVGKYIWKQGKKGKYAFCYLYNLRKRIYIGKQGKKFVALEVKRAS